jgi:uncharacterized tellurite resistance protein B-like protein
MGFIKNSLFLLFGKKIEMSPKLAFGATIAYLALSDGDIAKEEQEQLFEICDRFSLDRKELMEYLKLQRSQFEFQNDLLASAKSLSQEQKICIVLNTILTAGADKNFDENEKEFIDLLFQIFKIPKDDVFSLSQEEQEKYLSTTF